MSFRNLKILTYFDGLLFALMVGTAESYLLYSMSKNGVGGLRLAILSTVPVLLASLSMLLFPKFLQRLSVKLSLVFFLFIQTLGLAVIYYSSLGAFSYSYALVGLCLYWLGGQNIAPTWLDFIGANFPKSEFSYYIASRNSFVIYSTMIFFLLFSYVYRDQTNFSLLFLTGLIARFVSLLVNTYMVVYYRPKINAVVVCKEQVSGILKRFLTWGAMFRFSVGFSSPFFLSYMTNELNLSTPSYVWLTAMPFFGRAFFQSNWARASQYEKAFYGIQISALFISFLPWLWTLSSNYIYLLLIQVLSGMFWGGLELTQILMVQNYQQGNSRKYMIYQTASFSIMATLGAICGGLLLDSGFTTFNIFNISTVLRLVMAIALLYHIRNFDFAKLSLKKGTIYILTVLSLRPSLVNVMRSEPYDVRENDNEKTR